MWQVLYILTLIFSFRHKYLINSSSLIILIERVKLSVLYDFKASSINRTFEIRAMRMHVKAGCVYLQPCMNRLTHYELRTRIVNKIVVWESWRKASNNEAAIKHKLNQQLTKRDATALCT